MQKGLGYTAERSDLFPVKARMPKMCNANGKAENVAKTKNKQKKNSWKNNGKEKPQRRMFPYLVCVCVFLGQKGAKMLVAVKYLHE